MCLSIASLPAMDRLSFSSSLLPVFLYLHGPQNAVPRDCVDKGDFISEMSTKTCSFSFRSFFNGRIVGPVMEMMASDVTRNGLVIAKISWGCCNTRHFLPCFLNHLFTSALSVPHMWSVNPTCVQNRCASNHLLLNIIDPYFKEPKVGCF